MKTFKNKVNTRIAKRFILSFFCVFLILKIIFHIYSDQVDLKIRQYHLTRAVMNGDIDLYVKYGFNKDLSKYTNSELEIQRQIMVEILRKYVQESGTSWGDNEVENGMVLFSILWGGSPEFGGFGVADTEEGYALLQQASKKYSLAYPMHPRSTLIAERHEDGTVSVGVRETMR